MNMDVRALPCWHALAVACVVLCSAPSPTAADPVPPDFPRIQTTLPGIPAPGRIFLGSFSQSDPSAASYLMILENDGTPVFHRRLPSRGFDFKLQPDGRLTYFDPTFDGFYALDSTYTVVDSFQCGNGLTTDFHDLLVLPNGHALLMSYETRIMDMTAYDPKGWPNAEVVGLVIQEIDRAKNVVFEWKSWDHFDVTDATGISLGNRRVDYVHGNSLDLDRDGNLLLSSRSLNEVTKISRATGEVLWRLGGKRNQFQFKEGATPFYRQHSARSVGDGRLLLYDNGNFHSPPYSRAVEYEIDEVEMGVKEVWEYRHEPDVFGAFSGSVQRLPNGNTLVGWGSTTPTLTEVDPKGDVVYELTFDPGIFSYRAFRFDWPPMEFAHATLIPSMINTSIVTGRITGVLEPVGFDASAIDVSTVRLAGVVPAEVKGATLGDANGNGKQDLTVSFAREPLLPALTPATAQLEIAGSLTSGTRFHGFAPVRVISPTRATRPDPELQVISAPGVLPVTLALEAGAPGRARAVAVYDVSGRLVRRWIPDARGGTERFTWDGRRADGTPAASGIYFARVEGSNAPGAAGRIVITR
ncbi:MAG TPA: aryl-sulfate sulfotransferase [Candidatus Eisenbacteria bacterium]|nr:aryl-sulfate sulfotransferase [Candidatus Eisenbacteria bacterium]